MHSPYSTPAEWLNNQQEEPLPSPWLVQGLVPDEGVVIVASAPKAGKTCFISALARAVAEGKPFLGRPVRQAPVAWCSFEETPRERLVHLHDLDPQVPFFIGFFGGDFALDHPDYQYRVDRYGRPKYPRPHPAFHAAHDLGAKLLVVDCLHAATRFTNLAENGAARRYMDTLRDYGRTLGFAIVVLHHITKTTSRGDHPERFADSAQILASASAHIYLESRPLDGEGRRILLRCQGRYPVPDAQVEVQSRHPAHFIAAGHPSEKPKRSTKERLVDLIASGPLHAPQIADALDCPPATVRGCLAELVKSGRVIRSRASGRTKYTLFESASNKPERGVGSPLNP